MTLCVLPQTVTVICVHKPVCIYCLRLESHMAQCLTVGSLCKHMPLCCHTTYPPPLWQTRRKARKALEGEEGAAAEDDSGKPARPVLNTLRAGRPGGSRPRQGGASSNTVQAAAGLSRSKRKGLFAAGSDSENRPCGGAPPLNLQFTALSVCIWVVWLPA